MRSTPAIDEQLRLRLEAAVKDFADGNTDLFGRKVGYNNGGHIRQVIGKKRPVREALIDRVHRAEGMAGWFDAVLTSKSGAVALIQAKETRPDTTYTLIEALTQIARHMGRADQATREVAATILQKIALNPNGSPATIEMLARVMAKPESPNESDMYKSIEANYSEAVNADPLGVTGNTGSGEFDDTPVPPAAHRPKSRKGHT